MSLLTGKVQATIYENILSQGYVYLKDTYLKIAFISENVIFESYEMKNSNTGGKHIKMNRHH